MNEFRSKLLEIAWNELGNRDPTRYWRKVLGSWAAEHHAGLSWCGVFALWCLNQADLCTWTWSIDQHKPGFLFRLPRTTTPEPGDIAYFDKPYQHHALVQSVEPDGLHLIQGNYGVPGRVAESVTTKPATFFSVGRLVNDRL